MEYSELEKKVITKGKNSFINELQEASKPMLVVLKKYGVGHNDEVLKEIQLNYPYSREAYFQYAVKVQHDKLDSLNSKILDNFMEEIKDLKERVNDIEI